MLIAAKAGPQSTEPCSPVKFNRPVGIVRLLSLLMKVSANSSSFQRKKNCTRAMVRSPFATIAQPPRSNGQEAVRDHRHSHAVENLVDVCSVEYRRLDHRTRDRLEEPCHQKDRKGQAECSIGENQRPAGIDQSCLKVDSEQRQQ